MGDKRLKVLVLCPIGLGNYIMLLPMLEALSKKIGRENIDLLALKKGIKAMSERSEWVNQCYCWEPSKKTLLEGLKLMLRLRKNRYSHSINAFPSSNIGFYLFAAVMGAPQKIGFDYPTVPKRRKLLSKVFPVSPESHDVDQNLQLAQQAFATENLQIHAPSWPLRTGEVLRSSGTEKYYVCHPGSSAERGMKEKRLPPAKFAQVIKHIHEQHGLPCVLIGGPEEKDLRKEITSLCDGDFVREAQTSSLDDVANLISASDFYLGNDSGLMHIAASVGARCIVFYGPTDDRRAGPYSDSLRQGRPSEHLILRRQDLPCSPCWTARTVGSNPPCIHGDTRCLSEFPVPEFLPAIDRYIERFIRSAR